MLERFELLFAIVGGWFVSILFLIILRLKRGKTFPKGVVFIENEMPNESHKPGYNLFLLIGMGLISF